MTQKEKRLEALRIIITSKPVRSQQELMKEMSAAGYKLSQPTLSFYLRDIGASKVRTRDGMQYVLPQREDFIRPLPFAVIPNVLNSAHVREIRFADHLFVIRTSPHYAAVIARGIDEANLPTVAGTIAGLDTIFVAPAEGAERQQFLDEVATVVPVIKSVIP